MNALPLTLCLDLTGAPLRETARKARVLREALEVIFLEEDSPFVQRSRRLNTAFLCAGSHIARCRVQVSPKPRLLFRKQPFAFLRSRGIMVP